MTTDIASLALRVDALEVNQGAEALKRLQKAGEDTDRGVVNMSRSISDSFDRIALKAGAAYAAFKTVFGSAGEFLEFDKSLKLIETQLGQDTSQVTELESAIRELAATFGTRLAAQSKGFFEILSVGITDTAEATNLLTEANKLAIGGNADLNVVVGGLTAIMKGYGDKIKSVTDISDAFFTASLAGNITIEELAEGMGRVVPLAEVLGVSFDELSGAVSALTTAGVSSREAITSVRAVLAAIAKPSSEAADEAERLGLQFNAAAVQSKGLAGFLEDLKQKTGGNVDSMTLLFGGVESLLPALSLTGKGGVEFANIMQQMADKNGIAEESFKKLAAADQFKIDRFMAAINNIAITLGGTLSSILAPAAEAAASALNKLFGVQQTSAIDKQKKAIEDLEAKLVRMRGINSVIPGGIIYNKKDFDSLEDEIDNAKANLKELINEKEKAAQSIPPSAGSEVTGPINTGPPRKKEGRKSTKKDTISESEQFINNLKTEAREAGVTGTALLELRAKYLGVSETAAPLITKIKESELAMEQQRKAAKDLADDLARVEQITAEVATAEDVFIAKQNELNSLLSKGRLDPGTYFKALEKAGDDMQKSIQGNNADLQQLSFAVQGWGRMASDAFVDFATGGKASFSDFANSVVKDIARMYVQLRVVQPLLMSLPGLGGGVGNTGSAATASAASSVFTNLFKGFRATGGPVSANSMYRVNENGIPELFSTGGKQFLLTAGQSGQVTPMKKSSVGGGGSTGGLTVNIVEAPGKGGTTDRRETSSGTELDVMVDQLVAKKQVQRSSSSNKVLRQNFGLTDNLVMR